MRCLYVFAALALSAGCGLVDPDITDFELFIRDKQFTVDTAQWGLTDVDAYTGTDCTQQAGVCSAAAQQACTEGQCFGRCDAEGTGTCELLVLVNLWQPVVLGMDNPELATLDDQPLVDVMIDSIQYEVTENTLDVATPTFTIYVAPSTIMSPGDPEAEPVGTIAPVAAGTLVPLTDVTITADGQAALQRFMTDYSTPFNIIVGSEMVLAQGDTVPTGGMTARVQVRAHAGL